MLSLASKFEVIKFIIAALTLNFCFSKLTFGQSIQELYENKDFKKLIEHASSKNLTGDECFYIGFAYFQLEDDNKAIKMYDQAISKGLDEDFVYLFKGLSYRFSKRPDKAIENFKLAIKKNPLGQKNFTELANTYYNLDKMDSALVYFYKARELEFELSDPYLKIPNIFHVNEDFDKALEEYRISAQLIFKQDPGYQELLRNIGLLEYTHTKNYQKSIEAYRELIWILPKRYELYSKLIKAYYANEQYSHGDSLFNILKVQYEQKALPKEMQEVRGETVEEFYWNNQRISVMKYYKVPTEFAEPIFQFFIIDKAGKMVERKILTEKTSIELDGIKHVLCGINKSTGMRHTYPIAWKTDDIDYAQLKKYVLMILNDELKPQASSELKK